MFIDFLLERFDEEPGREAIVWRGESYSYGWLADRVRAWLDQVIPAGPPTGAVVALEADFSPNAIAGLLALVKRGCTVAPIYRDTRADKARFHKIAQVEFVVTIGAGDSAVIGTRQRVADHPLFLELRQRSHPGLVLFSSGTSGEPKGAVHDFTGLLEKFTTRRRAARMLQFLLFDHIGGLNTLLYVLSNAGTIILAEERSPDAICRLIEMHRVEVLPTSPTFLNLMLVSEAHRRHDLRNLKRITYGTEPMPPSTLARLHRELPSVELQQTYGLAEVGILRSKSRSDGSLWVKVGGEEFDTRVVNGILQIRARSAMLGYLNAPSPFTPDGWFDTGDQVETDGEYLRILGRASEIINVGGEKVYPAEVESVLQEMDNVEAATVYGEAHALVGQIVCAAVKLRSPEDERRLIVRLKVHCRDKLEPFKVPRKVIIAHEELYGERFKKVRASRVTGSPG